MNFGDVITGTIDNTSFRQVFYFQARRGDLITLRLTATDGDLDPLLLLIDNAGHTLAVSDDGGEALGSAIAMLEIPEDNYYFVIATRFGHGLGTTRGDFELSLERVGVLSGTAVFLSYGDSIVGQIDAVTPRLAYTFQARRGDIVNVWVRRISGNLDPSVYIADGEGQVLISNDDSGDSLDAAVESFLILDPGIYTVVVTRYGEESGTSEGSFVLTLDTAPISGLGLTPDAALLLRYGDGLDGTLDADQSFRYYTFGAQHGDVITIRMTRTRGDLDPLLVLLDASQQTLVEDDDSGEGNNALIQSYIVPATGTYYILATRFEREAGVTTGDYTVALEGVSGDVPIVAPGTIAIPYGSTVVGHIDDAQPSVTYAFLGRAGDEVTISLTHTSGDLDPLLYLFTTDGTQLATDDDSGPERDAQIRNFAIPQDGTYYVIATRFEIESGETSGDYSLTLLREDAPTVTPEVVDEGE